MRIPSIQSFLRSRSITVPWGSTNTDGYEATCVPLSVCAHRSLTVASVFVLQPIVAKLTVIVRAESSSLYNATATEPSLDAVPRQSGHWKLAALAV